MKLPKTISNISGVKSQLDYGPARLLGIRDIE